MIIKYLKEGDKFISITSLFGILGVIVGVSCLILSLSIMNGVEHTIKKSVIDVHGHFTIFGNITQTEEDTIRSEVKDLKSLTKFISVEALAINKGEITGVVINGINKNTYSKTFNFEERVIKGEFSFNNNNVEKANIGTVLSEKLGLNVGDKFQIVVPKTNDVMENSFSPKSKVFELAGVLDFGKYDYNDRFIIVEDESVQNMLGLDKTYSGIKLKLASDNSAIGLENVLLEKLGFNYHMQNWYDMNYNFFSSLALEKWAIFIILFFIILVASFNICSTLFVYVLKRFYDISILKVLGATETFLAKLFLSQGMFIALLGSIGGCVLGFVACFIVKNFNLVEVPANIYQFDHLPVKVEIFDIVVIVTSTMVIAFISTFIPATRGAKLNPVEGFRA